jgi:diguanylate cyclase (GGDEF)-like protein
VNHDDPPRSNDRVGAARPYSSFDDACSAALGHLRARYGMSLWFVSRTVGDEYILLNLDGEAAEVETGSVMSWADSICYRLTDGTPAVAPDLALDERLSQSPVVDRLGICAYVGVPLLTSDGELFGTLGAIDPEPQTSALHECLPEVELVGAMLMTVLDAELRVEAEQRRAERAIDDAHTDALCGIPNRRAWNDAIEREEARCRRYGSPAGVVIVDLDGLKSVNDVQGHAAGDALLRRAARVLASVVRESDLVARLGGDEFGVLVPGASNEELAVLLDRVGASLDAAQVAASVGARSRRPDMTLLETWHDADREMYRQKSTVVDRTG